MSEYRIYRVPATANTVLLFDVDIGYELSWGQWHHRNPGPSPSYVKEHFELLTGALADLIALDFRAWWSRDDLASGRATVPYNDKAKASELLF